MLFAVGSGGGHLLLLVSLIGPFHLCTFYPSKGAGIKDGEKRLCWDCCCDNTSYNTALIAYITSMAGLAHGGSQRSSPINLFFSD